MMWVWTLINVWPFFLLNRLCTSITMLFIMMWWFVVVILQGDVYIPALWQAPLLEGDETFPVIVLSHGIGGNRTTYSAYCCELASRGFIVAAVEHRDGTASMTYLLKDNLQRTVVELGKDRDCEKQKRPHLRRSYSFKEEWRSFQHTDPLGIKWDDYDYRNRQVLSFALLSDYNVPRKQFTCVFKYHMWWLFSSENSYLALLVCFENGPSRSGLITEKREIINLRPSE